MLQTIPEIIIGGLLLLTSFLVLYLIGKHARKISEELEQEVMRLPLIKPEETSESRESLIFHMKHKWQGVSIIGGIHTMSSSWIFWNSLFLLTIIMYIDYQINSFVTMYILLVLFIVVGLLVGIAQIMQKSAFWNRQINPIKGFETYLEEFVQKTLLHRPPEPSERQIYHEVEQSRFANWDSALRSSIKQMILLEISTRELSSDNRQLFLEYLTRHDGIISEAAIDLQEDIVKQEA